MSTLVDLLKKNPPFWSKINPSKDKTPLSKLDGSAETKPSTNLSLNSARMTKAIGGVVNTQPYTSTHATD